jgi:hypothetical protein
VSSDLVVLLGFMAVAAVPMVVVVVLLVLYLVRSARTPEVSDRPIKHIARNDAKRHRQARVAVWFAHQLVARGARDLRPRT